MKSFSDLLKQKKILISAAIVFLFIVTSALVGAYFLLGKDFFDTPKSQIKISIEGEEVKFNFDITPKDKEKAEAFSNSLGVNTDWTRGISLQFDEQTVSRLNEILPPQLDMVFVPSGVEFSSKSVKVLTSALPDNKYELATTSGKLTLNYSNEKDFDLVIVDPTPLINYASESAKLHLSLKLEGVLPIASKIDRIEVISRGGEIRGKIVIKN